MKTKCVIFGGGAVGSKLENILKTKGVSVRTTPMVPEVSWNNGQPQIVFVEVAGIEEEWSLSRFCDGARLAYVVLPENDAGTAAFSCARFLLSRGVAVILLNDSVEITLLEVTGCVEQPIKFLRTSLVLEAAPAEDVADPQQDGRFGHIPATTTSMQDVEWTKRGVSVPDEPAQSPSIVASASESEVVAAKLASAPVDDICDQRYPKLGRDGGAASCE